MGFVLSCFQWYYPTLALPQEKVYLLQELEDPNAALANELRGQGIHVDMTKSFEDWPMGARHPDYDALRVETDRILEKSVPP